MPDFPEAHYNLGNILRDRGRLKEAEPAFRESTRLRPGCPQAHCNLGQVLRRQGRFTDALESLRRGHLLGSRTPGWFYPSAAWVRECERLLTLDHNLPAVLRGEKEPASAAERLEFAGLCQRYKRLHVASIHFYAAAFATDPKLAADLNRQHRYSAACAAALAAAGNAEDARELAVEEWAWLQQRTHDWVRADLTACMQLAAKGNQATRQTIRKRLLHWQSDPELLAVRDREWLVAMPAEERARWERLWADVAALLREDGKDG
jgi:tetratricopeptide (TPR) repeat protein